MIRKAFLITSISLSVAIMASCGGRSKQDKVSADTTIGNDISAAAHNSDAIQDTTGSIGTENTGTTVATSSKGAALIAKSDCLACHKEHDKLVGPAYAEVAKKYNSGDVDKLAEKVIKGGAGSFGDVAMSPHPMISTDDAREMVKYILTVK
jgi:cytochrome c